MPSSHLKGRSSALQKTTGHLDLMNTDPPIRAQRAKMAKSSSKGKRTHENEQGNTSNTITIANAIEDYLQDHVGGNHSEKTLEWHATALGLLRRYLEEKQNQKLVEQVEANDISAWFAYLRKVPGSRGKPRSERTVQTYARSARAFFHWLIRRGTLEHNPFDRVVFPKVGRPLIQTITDEEFERLLQACVPSNESGPLVERAIARNRAILWLLYDTGIRVSELCGLLLRNFDRKHGIVTVKGKGSKERRIALGNTCQRNLLHYLDRHRPGKEELAEWGNAGEEHLFLSETRQPLTKNGMEMLFKRLKARAGITGKRISPHILRHTFAIRYLMLGNDPFSLQELLGHEDLTTVKNYMHMNDGMIQEQKRKYSPGDHLPTRTQESKEARRTGFIPKTRRKRADG
jgi:integrase/recombinase XerD